MKNGRSNYREKSTMSVEKRERSAHGQDSTTNFTKKDCTSASVVIVHYFRRMPNLIQERDGRVISNHTTKNLYWRT